MTDWYDHLLGIHFLNFQRAWIRVQGSDNFDEFIFKTIFGTWHPSQIVSHLDNLVFWYKKPLNVHHWFGRPGKVHNWLQILQRSSVQSLRSLKLNAIDSTKISSQIVREVSLHYSTYLPSLQFYHFSLSKQIDLW